MQQIENRYRVYVEFDCTHPEALGRLRAIQRVFENMHDVDVRMEELELDIAGGMYDVELTHVGDKKIQVIKEVRAYVPGLGLKDAKDLVDRVSAGHATWIIRGAPEKLAKRAEAAFEMAGATCNVYVTHLTKQEIADAVSGLRSIEQELA